MRGFEGFVIVLLLIGVAATTYQAFVDTDGDSATSHGPTGGELLVDVEETLQLTNPPPLLLGLVIERRAIEWRWTGERADIGAYEYVTPYALLKKGDVRIDGRVDLLDVRWCAFCWSGPGAPYAESIRRIATQELIPVACWLCDFDEDGDGDLCDFAEFQRLFTGPR